MVGPPRVYKTMESKMRQHSAEVLTYLISPYYQTGFMKLMAGSLADCVWLALAGHGRPDRDNELDGKDECYAPQTGNLIACTMRMYNKTGRLPRLRRKFRISTEEFGPTL